MAKINFKTTSRSRTLKPTPSKYRESAGRPNISQSDGIRPAFPLMPFTGLSNGLAAYISEPYEDVSTQDKIVIPKGKIVSAITQNSTMIAAGADTATGSSYYGVSKGVMGLIVPANGGANARELNTTQADDIVVNIPIGVAEHDVYEDLGSQNLNYVARNKNWGVLCHQLIKLPVIDVTAFDAFMNTDDGFLDTSIGEAALGAAGFLGGTAGVGTFLAGGVADGYANVTNKWSFLHTYGQADAGAPLMSDWYGNWMEAKLDGSNGAQVVGKLMGVDYRMNKDLLDTVQSTYDSAAFRTAGTGTYGVSQFVYDFAYDSISAALAKATETWDAKDDFTATAGALDAGTDVANIIKTATDEGVFGEAWILVNV
jgi:hypothetical protein